MSAASTVIDVTGQTSRIAIGWSAARIAELRQLVNETLPGRYSIESELAPALLLAAEGDFGQAEARVLELVQAYSGPDRLKDPVFFPLFLALFVIQRFDLASRMLRERWALDCAIELRIGAPSPGFACVRWEIASSTLVRFVFDETVLGNDNTRNRILSFHWLFPLFADYIKRGAEASGAVNVSLWDEGIAPGLAFCSKNGDHFLIPDNLFISTRAYELVHRAYRENDVPWEQRRAVAFWRGATTGLPRDRKIGWRSLPRIRLCEIGQQHSDLIDAGISALVQISEPAAEDEIRESGLTRPFVPAAEFNRYRYQIDIDGNTNSWPGLYQKLLTGSPVLKIASPSDYRQWYYDRLKPWTNFIPVAADMVDLVDKIRWLRDHDDAARAIGEQGQALALSMDYEGELQRAGRTITAALRTFCGQPETELRFGAGQNGVDCLRDGWSEVSEEGAAASGCESRLKLPRPVAAQNFVLSFDLTPVAEPPAPIPQRIVVIVNGEVLLGSSLTERQTLHCPLSRRTMEADEALFVTLLHPDARISASAAHPLDGRMVSFVLHRVTLTAAWVHGARGRPALPPGPEGGRSVSWAGHAQANPLAAGSRSTRLLTNHGTAVFVDAMARELRHGPPAHSPTNVFLVARGQSAYLMYQGPNGAQLTIRVPATVAPPQGPDLTRDGEPSAAEFRVVPAQGSAFGLARDGLFLCAEDDGRVTLSRQKLGPWELFHA